MSYGPLAMIHEYMIHQAMHVPLFQSPQVWYKFHRSKTTNIKWAKRILIFWKPTKGHNSKSYGPLAPIPVHTIHPVIVHVDTSFQLPRFHSSLEICCENFQEWQNLKNLWRDNNSKRYGPLATILPLHLPYLRDQVVHKFHWSRTTKMLLKTYKGT